MWRGALAWVRRPPKVARITITVLGGLLLAAVAFDAVTASPAICTSCHGEDARADSWRRSAHTVVSCVECHQRPTAWYALPARVVDRSRLLGRDITAHFRGEDAPAGIPSAEASRIGDDVCLQCHDPNRKATSGFRILIDHAEHAKRNGSCVSCHLYTAHPIGTRGTPLSLMSQCFTCHGTPEKPKASAECDVCHPADYEPLPVSHAEDEWATGHGDVSQTDPEQCVMCHEQRFCDDCHGLAMPHPEGWAKGSEGHGAVAVDDEAVCAQCHGGARPDLCTMCHHTSYDPTRGTWIEQHSIEARDEGAAYCMECHAGPYCYYCHAQPAAVPGS